MLFNVAFIFCLFVITSVGATGPSSPKGTAATTETRRPEPGEIVLVQTGSLRPYYEEAHHSGSYHLAVFQGLVTESKDKKDGNVLVIVPRDALLELFPLRLRKQVTNYLDQEPIIGGFSIPAPTISGGSVDLAISHPIIWSDLELSSIPTTMSEINFQAMTKELEKNLAVRGLPPLPITLGGVNTGKKIDRIYIQPGQVVEFNYVKRRGRPILGVVVSFTGQGKMAIIAILKNSKKSKKINIDISDFSVYSWDNGQESKPISGEFDLTKFHFINNRSLNPQPATFNNQKKFDVLVNRIVENMKIDKKLLGSSVGVEGTSEARSGGAGSSKDTNAAGSSSGDRSSVPKYIGKRVEPKKKPRKWKVPGVVPTDAY